MHNFSVLARSGFFKKTTEANSLFILKKKIQNWNVDEKQKNNKFFNKLFYKTIHKNIVSKSKLFSRKKKLKISKRYKQKNNKDLIESSKKFQQVSETNTINSMEFIAKKYMKESQKKTTLRTATKILSCFARRGNHPRINNLFTKYRKLRAKKTKTRKKLPLPFYRPVFFHAATPFLRLKTRRQRKRRGRKKLFQKINFRRRETGERQSYLLFSKVLQKTKKSTKSRVFRDQIQTQRESLFRPKTRRKMKTELIKQKQRMSVQTTGIGANVTKNIRQIRDEIHKRAFRIKPRKWRVKNRGSTFNKTLQKKKSFTSKTKKSSHTIASKLKRKEVPIFFSNNMKNIFKQKLIDFKETNKRAISNKKNQDFKKKNETKFSFKSSKTTTNNKDSKKNNNNEKKVVIKKNLLNI